MESGTGGALGKMAIAFLKGNFLGGELGNGGRGGWGKMAYGCVFSAFLDFRNVEHLVEVIGCNFPNYGPFTRCHFLTF